MGDSSKSFSLILILILAISSVTVIFATIPFGTAQSTVTINADGSVTGTSSIGLVNNNTYSFFANVTGDIQVQISNIVIDGAGYTLEGSIDLTNDVQHDPTRPIISVVTVDNLYINNGIETNGGGYDTFYNDYITNGIFLLSCSNNNISYCTIDGSKSDLGAIFMVYSDNNTITENNIIGGIAGGSFTSPTIDKNYWTDWTESYSIPDDDPLSNPVVIPLTSSAVIASPTPSPTLSPTPTLAPTASISEFPTWVILPLFAAIILLSIVFVRKRIPKKSK